MTSSAFWLPSASHISLPLIKNTPGRDARKSYGPWSIEEYKNFWETWWEYGGFVHSFPASQVVEPDLSISQVPRWFPGARLNFAENLLRFRDDKVAIYATGEGQPGISTITYNELYQLVGTLSRALKGRGVQVGHRVVGYLPNCPAAIQAMLATAAIGATWSSTSPDFGVTGVLERFHQIDPSILFSVEAVMYNGKVHDHLAKLTQVVAGLKCLKKVVIVPFVHKKDEIDISGIPNSIFLDDFLREWEGEIEIEFEQVPFHHPLFIMFSSGTTGVPKCMVHSVGGTLVQIAKEHVLHCDLSRKDVFTYYTTTGWMMWNWLVVGLFSGCSLVLYDGSPLLPTPSILWDLVDKLGITVLGSGAKWFGVLEEKGVKPHETHNLSSLRAILSTGSPLPPRSFKYVYRDIKQDIMLGSITGGTDIISCFMGSNPSLPVYEGEIQSRNLAMAVEAWDENGQPVYDQSGELVCTKPFPSMPTDFWNDDGGKKYTKAYFSAYPDTWTHGDYIIINSLTGGITMLGRSDGTLNPNGVRFGSAEIYAIVEQFEEVSDSVCVGQRNKAGEERVVLFLKMQEDEEFNQEFSRRLAQSIRSQLSSRHVPSVMLPVSEIPYTLSGKKVEVAVRQVIQGQVVKNKAALSNPESLNLYVNLPQLQNWYM
ncbi:Acetoacetyl-CoA synthetase [Chionoecetes opilio]|uniref:Acetoacetyl-CoA synthetase n=1 Tax=Chionoecetes opilio TaxID=41210 RepID=A0A8J4Y3J4_CHIOP|nr:Acetoacetyl-CoA synthetase [Chionoecetes opilio]